MPLPEEAEVARFGYLDTARGIDVIVAVVVGVLYYVRIGAVGELFYLLVYLSSDILALGIGGYGRIDLLPYREIVTVIEEIRLHPRGVVFEQEVSARAVGDEFFRKDTARNDEGSVAVHDIIFEVRIVAVASVIGAGKSHGTVEGSARDADEHIARIRPLRDKRGIGRERSRTEHGIYRAIEGTAVYLKVNVTRKIVHSSRGNGVGVVVRSRKMTAVDDKRASARVVAYGTVV